MSKKPLYDYLQNPQLGALLNFQQHDHPKITDLIPKYPIQGIIPSTLSSLSGFQSVFILVAGAIPNVRGQSLLVADAVPTRATTPSSSRPDT